MKFTVTELRQLLEYVFDRDRGWNGGWYYGNKKYFEKRHQKIKAMLIQELKRHSGDDDAR